jgi:large subunit ribosomal protein L19
VYHKDRGEICKQENMFSLFRKIICNLSLFLYNPPRFNKIRRMDATLLTAIQASTQATKDLPDLRPGMEVEVHQIIKEGEKERTQVFKGIIISMKGKTELEKVITVRADVEGIGIEKIFPIASPFVAKIVVLRQFKVRRANIGYIRDLSGKAARLKEIK